MRRLLAPVLGLLAAAVPAAVPALAQERVVVSERPALTCELPVTEARVAYAAPAPHARHGGAPTATFEVIYNGFSEQAQASFQAAVDVWAQYVVSEVPIRIEANWTPLGTNILGSAGPFLLANDSPQNMPNGTPIRNTWYPFALADALAGRDLQPGGPDIEANFNSGFADWHYGTGEAPPPGRIDLFTVVVHELGHGLGFIGSAEVSGGAGSLGLANGTSDFPFLFDRFAEDCDGRALLDPGAYPDNSAALASVLQSAAYFDGPTVAASYGDAAPLHTPASWTAGSSYSHYDEGTFPSGSPGALMTPIIARGELLDAPDTLLCAALQDFGWELAPPCAALIPDTPPMVEPRSCEEPPPPAPELYTLVPLCSSAGCEGADTVVSTSGLASFVLTVAVDQGVDVYVFDTRGRRVAVISLAAEADSPETITVELGRAAGGLYLVRVVGETFAATRKVVRLR